MRVRLHFFVFFTLSNFIKLDNNLINKKINLGLDLQGGSYLLLEIDNHPVVIKELQNKLYIREEEAERMHGQAHKRRMASPELPREG